jgi:EAL domain-containing protein (putative c-di-GMP-specific phosphodiesterase class I)
MTYAQCRAAWPDKLFWANIGVSDYQLPPAQLKARVLELVAQATRDGAKLAFEVSEDLPANWRESIPVVMEALKETRSQ